MKYFLTALLLLSSISCKPRKYNESADVKVGGASPVGPGKFEVTWPCTGGDGIPPDRPNKQEEYCEWNRGQLTESKRLICVYRSSFDTGRKYYLTQRFNDLIDNDNGTQGNKDLRNHYLPTHFNSFPFLVGALYEPEYNATELKSDRVTLEKRDGLVPHCLAGKACRPPQCIDNRASDPHICDLLHTFSEKSCKVVLPKFQVVHGGEHKPTHIGDTPYKVTLRINGRDPVVKNSCKYITDPYVAKRTDLTDEQRKPDETLVYCELKDPPQELQSCDLLAQKITVVARIEVENYQACGVGQPQ